MRFQRIHEAVNFQPWFISSGGYESVRTLLERAMAEDAPAMQSEGDDDFMSNFVRVRPGMSIDGSGVAKIHIFGVVGLHLNGIEKSCGNTDFKDIEREIGEAVGLGAKGVLLVVDSPGGMITGCDECANIISNCPIPVVTFCDTKACSAAYYLASGSTAIVATQSAEMGNIGMIRPWVDTSKMLELIGVHPDPVFNEGADLKSIGYKGSLSDEQREFLQEQANEHGARFHAHIEAHRVIDPEIWRAGWYSGETAQRLGLIDYVGDESTAYGVLMSKIPLE